MDTCGVISGEYEVSEVNRKMSTARKRRFKVKFLNPVRNRPIQRKILNIDVIRSFILSVYVEVSSVVLKT